AREAQRRAAVLDRQAAGGVTLVRRARGVAGDDLDARRLQVQLVRGDLRQGGGDALPQLDLAGEDRHRAVRSGGAPGVEQAVRVEAPRQRGGPVLRGGETRPECESNDERAAPLEEGPAGGHGRISWAARCTARTIRLCEAQRHRWPLSAALISRSLGRGLRSSSALADMTMPLPQ